MAGGGASKQVINWNSLMVARPTTVTASLACQASRFFHCDWPIVEKKVGSLISLNHVWLAIYVLMGLEMDG